MRNGFGHTRGPVTGIQEWLMQLGLEKYAPVFEAHEITLAVLPHLTEPDLDQLGLPIGPRRRLVVAIEQLAKEIRARTVAEGVDTPATRSAKTDGASGGSSP